MFNIQRGGKYIIKEKELFPAKSPRSHPLKNVSSSKFPGNHTKSAAISP